MKKLSKSEMKNVVGGKVQECNTSVTCPGGGSVSCTSNGSAGNTQGGDSCQSTPSSVTCYDTGAPNNWSYSHC